MKRLTAFRFVSQEIWDIFPVLGGYCWCEGRCLSGQRERTVTPSAYAFSGSNPLLPTIFFFWRSRCSWERSLRGFSRWNQGSLSGCSLVVKLQPSKLITRVRFPSPAPFLPGFQLPERRITENCGFKVFVTI